MADGMEGWKGPYDGSTGPVGTAEGRMGGGGWVDSVMSVSAESNYGGHGTGVWEAPIGAHPEDLVGPIESVGTHPGDTLYRQVEGWDSQYLSARRPDWE